MAQVSPDTLTPGVLEAIFNETDEGICVVRVIFGKDGQAEDCEYLLANTSFERITGAAEIRGRRLSELAPDAPGHWLQLLGQVAQDGKPVWVSDHAPRLGHWFDARAFRVGAAGDALVAVRFRDITEHRRLHERLASLDRITTVGVLFWGEGFSLVDMNQGFLRMAGYSREEALGMTWQQFTPPEFHEDSLRAVSQVMKAGQSVPYEKQYIRRDGSRWWGLFAAWRVGDETVEFVLDITERRAAEAALRQADRRKDEFLATLAHELRNPLAPIRSGLHLLMRSMPQEPSAQQTLQRMDRQLSHLVHLVDDLLDVARISRGKARITRRPVALGDVLARSVEETQPAIEARQHNLEVAVPGEAVYIDGDFDRLAQVFSNLLSNAAKYTPPHGRLRIDVQAQPSQVLIAVSDNGVGIAPDQQAQVFELFTQVPEHITHTDGGGLGIGLSLVRSLVQLHDGEVWVESGGAGQGSLFCVKLPRLPAAGAAVPEAAAQAVPAAVASPLRVLVADDNADAAQVLAALLRIEGHEVVTAANGAEAVRLEAEFAPDLTLLDLGMPVMDGFEAARRIRAQPHSSRTFLVALTGWGQPADRERTRQAGFDLHLVKPVSPEDLDQVLQAAQAAGR